MGQLGRTQKSQAASEKKLKAYVCELEQKLEARTRELAEALEQHAATGEILGVIAASHNRRHQVPCQTWRVLPQRQEQLRSLPSGQLSYQHQSH